MFLRKFLTGTQIQAKILSHSGECDLEESQLFALPLIPTGIYLCKVNNRNTRTRCEICSKLTIKIFFVANFEHISHLVLVFLLLTLNM